jgi:hypothetical protein
MAASPNLVNGFVFEQAKRFGLERQVQYRTMIRARPTVFDL